MTGIIDVVNGAGFNTAHAAGVVSALLVIAIGVVVFGGVWFWLRNLSTGEQPVRATVRLTAGPDDSPDAAPVPPGVKVENIDEVSVDRETALAS